MKRTCVLFGHSGRGGGKKGPPLKEVYTDRQKTKRRDTLRGGKKKRGKGKMKKKGTHFDELDEFTKEWLEGKGEGKRDSPRPRGGPVQAKKWALGEKEGSQTGKGGE